MWSFVPRVVVISARARANQMADTFLELDCLLLFGLHRIVRMRAYGIGIPQDAAVFRFRLVIALAAADLLILYVAIAANDQL